MNTVEASMLVKREKSDMVTWVMFVILYKEEEDDGCMRR